MKRVNVNPTIPGYAPDPSVVYVDGTYFLVNSSFHIFPGLPIYASKDLRGWKHIGNALNRTTQLSLQRTRTRIEHMNDMNHTICAEGGLYAPTIRHHKGTFYIVCTNVLIDYESKREQFQNFILTTTDIWTDEWSDPIFYDFHGIDTSLFWDDDDRVYLIGSRSTPPETTIWQFEIDVKTGAQLSEAKLLWEGITRVFPEGPHMYKKDGWYYILIAEGGCFADHHTVMARSRDVWGPYEVNPANPVLPKADPKGYIQYTGHGDLFQSPAGQWYFMCLGARKNKGRFIMGRESFLTTATWAEGEFPVIDPVQVDVPLATDQVSSPLWPARRKAGRADVAFVYIRDPVLENYHHAGNSVTLTSSLSDVTQAKEPVTFIGKRQRRLDGACSVKLDLPSPATVKGSGLKTGLCYYKDEQHYIQAYWDAELNEVVLKTVNNARFLQRRTAQPLVVPAGDDATLALGIDYTELEFVFWYSTNDEAQQKKELGRVDTLELTGHDFVGPIIGIFATSGKGLRVRFTDFLID